MLDGKLCDVDLSCVEPNFGVAKIIKPHPAKTLVESRSLDRRPGGEKMLFPTPKGFGIRRTKEVFVANCHSRHCHPLHEGTGAR